MLSLGFAVRERKIGDQELVILKAAENTNEAFITIDQDHRVLFFNKAAERIFGYPREKVIGQDLSVIMAPTCSRDHRRAVERYVQTRIPVRIGHDTELTATRKNGETFPANISFSVSEIGERIYFTGIVRDLTETKALQERVLQSERLAALGKVVAEISHEIKNPLIAIGGFARQLLKEAEDEKVRRKLSIILNEAQRLENLLNDLRDFYSTKKLKIESMDINDLLNEIYLLFKDDCGKRNIEFSFQKDRDRVLVNGDRGKLKQVFVNIVKNAMEALEGGGSISIDSRVEAGKVEISISDNGCGIPKDQQEKVFSPFFSTKEDGSGLGLSISKRIIEDHKGSSFKLESKENKGTRFTVTVPTSGT